MGAGGGRGSDETINAYKPTRQLINFFCTPCHAAGQKTIVVDRLEKKKRRKERKKSEFFNG